MVKRLYCCDISKSYLKFAKKECAGIENISFHKIKSAHIDFLPPESVDAVFAHAVFIHLNLFDIFWYFHEFKRIVRAGGRVWLDIADTETLDPAYNQFFLQMAERYRKAPDRIAKLKQWNSCTAVVKIAEDAGFQLTAMVKPRDNTQLLFLKTATAQPV